VTCWGAALTLQGVAVECRGGGRDSAVLCISEGSRAELSGCTLTSPEGHGLGVHSGATATMDGGSISGCGQWGVLCEGSGSTATVRPPAAAPSAAPPCPLRAAGAAAFLGPVSPLFSAVVWHRKRSRPKNDRRTQKHRILFGNRRVSGWSWLSVVRVWAAARGHPRAEQEGLRDEQRRQDRGGRRGAVSRAVNADKLNNASFCSEPETTFTQQPATRERAAPRPPPPAPAPPPPTPQPPPPLPTAGPARAAATRRRCRSAPAAPPPRT